MSCLVPARQGLRRTTLALGRDETWAVNPLVRKPSMKSYFNHGGCLSKRL